MNSNWNTLVTPADGYDTDRDVYNAETFGSITKRKKPLTFDAPPGLDANKRFCERRPSFADGRPPLYPHGSQDEARIRSIVREEIYLAARNAVQATRPVASISLARPDDSNPSYLTPRRPNRTYDDVAPWASKANGRSEATWAPPRRPLQRSYHPNETYGCGRTGWEIMCANNPELLIRQQEGDNLLTRMGCSFDDLQ